MHRLCSVSPLRRSQYTHVAGVRGNREARSRPVWLQRPRHHRCVTVDGIVSVRSLGGRDGLYAGSMVSICCMDHICRSIPLDGVTSRRRTWRCRHVAIRFHSCEHSCHRQSQLVSHDCGHLGAAAGLALSVAACMTMRNGDLLRTLPDTRGMRLDVVLDGGSDTRWTPSIALPGAHVVLLGKSGAPMTRQQLEAHLRQSGFVADGNVTFMHTTVKNAICIFVAEDPHIWRS